MKVVILCGGRGIRARPLTKNTPKPLVKIGGRPFLSYLVDYFYKRSFRDIILCTGFRGDDIRRWAADNSKCSFEISHMPSASIVQRIYGCRKLVDDKFMVCYGDTLADTDMDGLLGFHESHDGMATITTYKYMLPFGMVEDIREMNYLVTSFREKKTLPLRINIGYMVFDMGVFGYMTPGSTMQGLLNKLARNKRLYAFRHDGRHFTFNTPNDVERLSQNVMERMCEADDR